MKLFHPVGLLLLPCIFLLSTVLLTRADLDEAEALVSWKASLGSADEILGSWSSANSASLCRWPRITCDPEAGHITEIDLLTVSLNGTLDGLDFSAFPHLKKLRLDGNGLHGTIPTGIGNLTSLVTLRILDNPNLSGTIPRSIGKLTQLKVLHLDILGLQSTIPEEIGNLTSLEELHMSSVTLTGPIPRIIGMLTKLRLLLLQGNNLTGSIPLEIQNMTELQTIEFSDNYLEGNLPSSIAHLMKLQFLDLASNHLGGHIVLELGNSSLLDEVYIGNNNFSGMFPPSICLGGAMKRVSAYNNRFTSIHQHTFQNCTSLKLVELTANSIVAELRDCFGGHPDGLHVMDLSQNYLYGSLVSGQGEVFLCNYSSLKAVDLSDNALSGGLFECIGDLPDLIFMDLSRNSFSGVVPFSCQHSLSYLHLANNHFRGTFPLGLKTCKSLITLDLGGNHFSGTIPSWVSMSLPGLIFLGLSSNTFDGTIPQQILEFRQLKLLDLSKNRLTGPIPADFTNFTGMAQEHKTIDTIHTQGGFYTGVPEIVWKNASRAYIVWSGAVVGMDLSDNFLSQEIPKGLTTLGGLRYLNLSGNHLVGCIPGDIGNLVLLEALDLRQNLLSGVIPPGLAALKSLSVLNLSYNGLSGRIPTGSQLQTLVDPSIYSHNPGLCGFPLEECVSSSTRNEVGHADDTEALWMYCFVAAGFIFGFWLYWGMLLFYSETWRCAFYQYVDNLQGKVTKKIYSCMSCFQYRGP